MSSIYTGKAGNVTTLPARSISSSTNATPIKVTTTVAHGFDEGDIVEIVDHQTNLNANRIWSIHIISSTEFELVGSTPTGVGGATGTATCLIPRPELTLPAALELGAAASVNVPISALADRCAYNSARNQNTINQLRRVGATDEGYTSWSAGTTSGTPSTWTEDTNFTTLAGSSSGAAIADVTYSTLDTIDIYFQTTIQNGGFAIAFQLYLDLYDPGVASAFSTATKVVFSDWQCPASYGGPLILRGERNISGFVRGKKARVYLAAMAGGASKTYNLLGSRELLVKVYRNIP